MHERKRERKDTKIERNRLVVKKKIIKEGTTWNNHKNEGRLNAIKRLKKER